MDKLPPRPERSHANALWPLIDRKKDEETYAAYLEHVSREVNFDPFITESLMAETTYLYDLGLPNSDSNSAAQITIRRHGALNAVKVNYRSLYTTTLTPEEDPIKRAITASENYEHISSALKVEKRGRTGSSLLSRIEEYTRFVYALELDDDPDLDLDLTKALSPSSDWHIIHEGHDPSTPFTLGKFSARLREISPEIASKRRLDAIATNFIANAEFEVSRLFLEDLTYLILANNETAPLTRKIADSYKDRLFDGNFSTTIVMQQDIIRFLDELVDRAPLATEKTLLQGLRTRQATLMRGIADDLDEFTRIYAAFNYATPGILMSKTAGQPEEAEPTNHPVEEVKIEVIPEDPELVAEILRQITELQLQIDKLTARWHMSSKVRGEKHFDHMHKELKHGYLNEEGVLILGPLETGFARDRVNIIVWLYKLAQAKDGAAQLKSAIEIKQRLQAQLNDLDNQVRAALPGKSFEYPQVPPVDSHHETIKQDWFEKYKPYIRGSWPNADGEAAAHALELFLFEIEPEKSPEEVLEEQITELLDIFVLPKEHGPGDVERELKSLGIKNPTESQTKIVWERLKDLTILAEEFDGKVYRSKKGTFGKAPPYFVALVKLDGKTYAIAESPVVDNATYIVTGNDAGTLTEILQLPRKDATYLGAAHINHHPTAPHGPVHRNKVIETLFKMHDDSSSSNNAKG